MTLKEQIKSDFMEAFKGKEEPRLSVLKMLKSDIANVELEKKTELNDEGVLELITRGIKRRRDAIEGFEQGGNKEMADGERAELKVLSAYLPEQLTEDEIKDLVKKAIEQIGATSVKDLGKVMSVLAPQIKGKTDGSQVSKMVREML